LGFNHYARYYYLDDLFRSERTQELTYSTHHIKPVKIDGLFEFETTCQRDEW
jgi:hypothetical protein